MIHLTHRCRSMLIVQALYKFILEKFSIQRLNAFRDLLIMLSVNAIRLHYTFCVIFVELLCDYENWYEKYGNFCSKNAKLIQNIEIESNAVIRASNWINELCLIFHRIKTICGYNVNDAMIYTHDIINNSCHFFVRANFLVFVSNDEARLST